MSDPDELRIQAKRYRKMALRFTDQRTVDALIELAEEYEATAAQMDASRSNCCNSRTCC